MKLDQVPPEGAHNDAIAHSLKEGLFNTYQQNSQHLIFWNTNNRHTISFKPECIPVKVK